MSNGRYEQGLVDTSVIIGLGQVNPRDLPVEFAVSAVTMAELAAGPLAHPLATADVTERAQRQDRLHRAEATFEASQWTSMSPGPTGESMPQSPRLDANLGDAERSICSLRRPLSRKNSHSLPRIRMTSGGWSH